METIKEKIKRKGVTAEQVAKMVGIDRSYLSRIMNGRQEVYAQSTEDRIHRYLDALNTDDENILKINVTNI